MCCWAVIAACIQGITPMESIDIGRSSNWSIEIEIESRPAIENGSRYSQLCVGMNGMCWPIDPGIKYYDAIFLCESPIYLHFE